MADLQTRLRTGFVRIAQHYGFEISHDIVANIQSMETKTKENKKAIVGIHFHQKCCVSDGKVVQIVNPQYSKRKYGWNHYCTANDGKNVYLNDDFISTQCCTDKLERSDHSQTSICGLFINFQV